MLQFVVAAAFFVAAYERCARQRSGSGDWHTSKAAAAERRRIAMSTAQRRREVQNSLEDDGIDSDRIAGVQQRRQDAQMFVDDINRKSARFVDIDDPFPRRSLYDVGQGSCVVRGHERL